MFKDISIVARLYKKKNSEKPVVDLGFNRSFGTEVEGCDPCRAAELKTEVART